MRKIILIILILFIFISISQRSNFNEKDINVISLSINDFNLKVNPSYYSEIINAIDEALIDFVSSTCLDITIGCVTGTLLDGNNKIIFDNSGDSKISANFKFGDDYTNELLENLNKRGIDYFSTVLDSAINTQYTYISYHTRNGTNKNPTPSKNLFQQNAFSFLC